MAIRASPSSMSMHSSGSDVDPNVTVEYVCVGLMRTGLQSMKRAFQMFGIPESEIYDQEQTVAAYELWDNVISGTCPKESLAAIFRGRRIVIGMPTFCFWEDILELYPNARVILNVRSEDQWWSSICKSKQAFDNDVPGAPLKYATMLRHVERFLVPSYFKFCQILRFAWATSIGSVHLQGSGLNESTTRRAFRKHNCYVRSLLENRVNDQGLPRLLVYDVRQGWAPLCEFLGQEAPPEDFPSKQNLREWPDGLERPDWYDKVTGFDDLFAPFSALGIQMRIELRRGLLVFVSGLTILLTVAVLLIFVVAHRLSFLPPLLYLSMIIVGFSAYGVAHQLVARVPLLLIIPLATKTLLIAASLHACHLSYGMLKEMLVTRDHIASSVLVLSSRLMSILGAAIYMLLTEGRVSFGAPILQLGAFAFTNEASTWAGYEMLRYVSFPLQVMAKSVKMLPNMIMGRVLNGTKYSVRQYVEAISALVLVGIMHFSDGDKSGKAKGKLKQDEDLEPKYKLMMGIVMLIVFFVTDAFTSNWQTALYKKYTKMTQVQMMLGGNVMGFLFTSSTIFASWTKITASMEIAFQNPAVMWRIIGLGISSALGQFCIYSAIKVLGSLSLTWIMTARQLLSVLISLVVFGHGVSFVKVCCIVGVFGIMSAKQLAKVAPVSEGVRSIKRRMSMTHINAKME